MSGRLLGGHRDLKNPYQVCVTAHAGRRVIYTATEYLSDFRISTTLTSLYRWLRQNGHRQPIALHSDDGNAIAESLDELADECRSGRLSVTLTTDLPPVPPNPDQEINDLLTLLDAWPIEG